MKIRSTAKSLKKVFLVDGYNAVHQIPEIEAALGRGLENARNKLALYLFVWGRIHPGFECIIVFDGDPRFSNSQDICLYGIRCLFSRTSHGGDNEIIRIAKEFQRKNRDITVASDDNYVRNSCRDHGANVVPIGFIVNRPARQASPRQVSAAAGRGMNPKEIAAINKELLAKYGMR